MLIRFKYVYLWIVSVNYRPDQGFFAQFFQWHGDAPSRVHVIRKSDGQLLTTINTTAVFVTHQVSVRRMTFDAGMSLQDMLKYKCFDVYSDVCTKYMKLQARTQTDLWGGAGPTKK